jgi:hypothetical protein
MKVIWQKNSFQTKSTLQSVFKRNLHYNPVRQTFGTFRSQNDPKQGGLKLRGTQYSLLCADDAGSLGDNAWPFIMFSAITKIYNKKTKGPTLMELFTATRKTVNSYDN